MKLIGATTGVIIAANVYLASQVWVVTLLLGAAHSADGRVPAFGWTAVLPLMLIVDLALQLNVERN